MSAIVERTPATRTRNLGAQVDALWAAREKKKTLAAQLGELEQDIANQEQALLAAMEQQGLDKLTGKRATVSASRSTTASVEDWDQFYAYIHRHKYYHLLHRRVSEPAYRELLEHGKKVPGVQPFIKTHLNLRTV